MAGDVSLSVLDRVRIASPCPARWEDMTPTGDGAVRHCGQCNLKVHNLSAMSRGEAEALLGMYFGGDGAKRGERLCGQWRRRADNTIIFGDCPVGLAKLRARVRRSVARVAAMAGLTSLLAACSRDGGGGGHADSDDGATVWMGIVAAPAPVQAPEPAASSTPTTPEDFGPPDL
jgi:hypothetical protein